MGLAWIDRSLGAPPSTEDPPKPERRYALAEVEQAHYNASANDHDGYWTARWPELEAALKALP